MMPGSGHSRGAAAGAWSQRRSFPCVHYNALYSDPRHLLRALCMFVWSLCKVLARAGGGALCVLSKGLGDCLRVLFAGFCGVGLGGFCAARSIFG